MTNTPQTARWARLPLSPYFHVVDSSRPYSVVTMCNGAWNVEDETVEWHDSPPEDERCPRCMRTVVDPHEHGLAELANHYAFDLGGDA